MTKKTDTLPLADPHDEQIRQAYQRLREFDMYLYDQQTKVTRQEMWGSDYWLVDKLKAKRALKK